MSKGLRTASGILPPSSIQAGGGGGSRPLTPSGGFLPGTITMALLEHLLAGNVYLVQIAASNEAGEGPFSSAVELAVSPKEAPEPNQRPKRLDSAAAAAAETGGQGRGRGGLPK